MNWLYVALAAALFGGGLYVGRLTVEVPAEKAVVKQEQTEIQQEAKQITTNTAAEATHDTEVENRSPLIIKQPVWLREPPNICLPLPATPANQPPAERPTDPGPGPNIQSIDLRPALAEFAQKYENALSDCRRMASEWPK
jgi:hypothetical protein